VSDKVVFGVESELLVFSDSPVLDSSFGFHLDSVWINLNPQLGQKFGLFNKSTPQLVQNFISVIIC
jgi:hypothetical protein